MPTQLPDKTEWPETRVLEVHEEFLEGATLRELGKAHGISHERIRQLFEKHGLVTRRPPAKSRKPKLSNQKVWDLYKKHGTVEAVVVEVDASRDAVAAIIDLMPLRQIYRRKGQGQTYDPDYILDCLREAAKVCGEPLTIPSYRAVAPQHKWPADLTVTRAFGSWADACKAAGVKANPKEGPRNNAYTEDDCLNAIRIYAAEHDNAVPSYEQYSEWARANRQPSGPTIRVKCGPWRTALTKAFD